MKFLYLLLFVLGGISLTLPVSAQPDKGTITGKVTDIQGAAVPFANVALYRSSDSSLVDGTASDENGNFSITANTGTYFLKISFLTFEEKTVRNINLTSAGYNAGTIKLSAGSVGLDEVVVETEKSQMQFQLDKKVYNVGSDITSLGSSAAELLNNVPSVDVDIDGNVRLRGSQNVRILINGKPSGLIGMNPADALKQIPAHMIESVELITNPSARYDAEGEVGIINIILKKEKQKGINGAITANAGYPQDFGLGINMNFRREKINFFTNIGIEYDNRPGSGYSYQEFFNPGEDVYIYETDRAMTRGGASGNVQFGVDLFLNNYNTLTISGLYDVGKDDNISTITYRDLDQNRNILNQTVRTDHEEEVDHDIETALNYTKTFKQKNRKWTFDFSYMLNDDTETSNYEETFTDTSGVLVQRSRNTEDQQNILFQTDYVHPVGKDGKWEAGAKATLRSIENAFQVEEQKADGSWFVIPGFNDELAYDENIIAAYGIYGNKLKKFSYQGGLRAEYSDITTTLVESDTSNPRSYIDFFPTIHLGYEINKANQLQVSYSRRLSRPHFRMLLPFYTFSDSRSRFQGNPDLDPEYSNSFELGYLRYFKKGSLLSTAYYRYKTGVIERLIVVDTTGVTQMFPINLSTENSFGLELSGNYEITKWWNLTGSANFYRAITEGKYEGEKLSSDAYSASGRISSRFKLPKQTQIQTSFNYRAPRETTQGYMRAGYAWDAGISKEVLKGNGTLTFNVRDILNSRKRFLITETPYYYAESEFQWHARQFTLAFSYRINRSKKQMQQNRNGEMEDMDF